MTPRKVLSVFLLITMTLVLSSCFGSTTDENRGLILMQQEKFSLMLPSTWAEISHNDLPVPKSGKVEFAYASPTQRQGYINNIIVLSSQNAQAESSKSLMKSNTHFLNQNLESFDLVEERNLTFADSDEGLLVKFYGKYNTSTPEVVYLQTAKSCGDASYYITLSLAEKLDSYDRYEYLLQSFQCS